MLQKIFSDHYFLKDFGISFKYLIVCCGGWNCRMLSLVEGMLYRLFGAKILAEQMMTHFIDAYLRPQISDLRDRIERITINI